MVKGGAAVARIGAMAASSTTWVATPEAYPTAVCCLNMTIDR